LSFALSLERKVQDQVSRQPSVIQSVGHSGSRCKNYPELYLFEHAGRTSIEHTPSPLEETIST